MELQRVRWARKVNSGGDLLVKDGVDRESEEGCRRGGAHGGGWQMVAAHSNGK